MSGELLKVSAVIIVAAILVTALRGRLGEHSFLLVIVVIVVVLVSVLGNLFNAIDEVKELLFKSGNSGEYFTVALKALGISYITTFAADMCRDYGLSAFAQTAETTGKITIFILSLPLVKAILHAAIKFVGL